MKKLHNIKAVGFDLDDTLVMTEAKAFETENRALARMGRPPMSREVHQRTWGRHILEAMSERSPGVDVTEFAKAFEAEFRAMLEHETIDLITPEVEQMLLELGKRNLYLFILTGRDGFETAHLAEGNHPISVHIVPDNVYHKDNLPYSKPDARVFGWLWAKGFKPEEVIYVGDSVYDGRAACGAEVNFVATLESGLRQKADFEGVEVTAFINKLPELLELLD